MLLYNSALNDTVTMDRGATVGVVFVMLSLYLNHLLLSLKHSVLSLYNDSVSYALQKFDHT